MRNRSLTSQEIAERFVEYDQAATESLEMAVMIELYKHTIYITVPEMAYDGVMFRPYFQPDLND